MTDDELNHDPDDVADLVAHDAAAGLPGFARVGEPQENTLAWAARILTRVPPATRAQTNIALEASMVAVARAVQNRAPKVTWQQLLESLLDELIETLHGPGVAVEVETLMSWWRDLDDDKRASTGVPLTRTLQPPAFVGNDGRANAIDPHLARLVDDQPGEQARHAEGS